MRFTYFLLLQSTKTHTLKLEMAPQGKLGLQERSKRKVADEVMGNVAIMGFKYKLTPKN